MTAAVADEAPLTYDRVSFSVDAQADVANDTLSAVLFSQREGSSQAEVADAVNTIMRWALDTAKGSAGVKVQTLNYTTSPIYRNQDITGWRVRQAMRLESQDSAGLTKLIGRLQERLSMESVNYTISRDTRLAAEERLIAEAIASYRKRASLIAAEYARASYRLVHVDVAAGGYHGPPIPYGPQMLRAEAAVAPPAIESGDQTLTVTVSGTIELTPAQ